ncbi:MAG: flagellar basal body P-ring protein FlgI [Mycobacterium sp.]
MKHRPQLIAGTLILIAIGPVAVPAEVTVRVADVTTLKGYGVNHLVGTGLVVGLGGTGDGDQYEVTMRALAAALDGLAAPVSGIEELKDTKNVAIVMVDAVIPEHGVREGDRIDVHVSAIGSAKSLVGGRLLVAPLMYHDLDIQTVFAYASGPIHLTNIDVPTTGVVERGAVVNEDVLVGFTALGRALPFTNDWIRPAETYITFVLDDAHAGWGLSVAIAESINSELSLAADVERVAIAADPKSVIVWLPPFQRSDPASWIRDIEELSTLIPASEARVTIDRSTGTIVVSGNARISPVVVSHKGMTIVVRYPPPAPTDPRIETQQFIELDTDPTPRADVTELLRALNQLQVPIDDRIAILTQIQRAGKLHAKLAFRD